MAQTKALSLDELMAIIRKQAMEMLTAKETGFITLHFDGKCGVRHEIDRKGELTQINVPLPN